MRHAPRSFASRRPRALVRVRVTSALASLLALVISGACACESTPSAVDAAVPLDAASAEETVAERCERRCTECMIDFCQMRCNSGDTARIECFAASTTCRELGLCIAGPTPRDAGSDPTPK